MCLISSLKFVIFFLPLCRCFFVEISLSDKNESKSLKLVCGPPAENRNLKGNHTVLWHGSQFGSDEQQKLAETMQTGALVPNISISSSKRHRCYLLTDEDTYKSLVPQKKRVSRQDSEASIPTENGNCRPGYRIDQDRCFPCFPGSYTSGQDSVCFLCPKDFYIDKKAADSCWPCPDGKKTLAQGADSEESCVYFDESGHPTTAQGPPWVLILSLVGIIIAFVWIIIIVLFVRYWLNRDAIDQTEGVERASESRSSKPLLKSGIGDQPHESSDPEDHIYAEIGDFDHEDTYEEPRRPSDSPVYVDIVPEVPEKRPRKSSARRDSAADHLYELPVENSSDHLYEIPIPKGSCSHSYEVPIRRSSKRTVSSGTRDMYDGEPSMHLPKRHSTGFEPSSSSTRMLPKLSTETGRLRKSRRSDSSVRELMNSEDKLSLPAEEDMYDLTPDGSEENMYDLTPEEEDNVYDIPPEE